MRFFGHNALMFAMLLAAGLPAAAQSHGDAWVSYRDAYKQMVRFEKYGKPKQLLQSTLQVAPKDKAAPLDGLRLTLSGKATQLNLPLDATGRAVFPLLKAAYDENAALVLNQDVTQYVFRPRISIAVRPDGVYETGDLRAACEQALAYQRYLAPASVAGKKCVGVRFAYPKGDADVVVRLRRGEQDAPLRVEEGAAFPGDAVEHFRIANYRFAEVPVAGQVSTHHAPVAIAPLFE
ncbi:hypothetical protein [Pseudoduganella sp. GCM10020061]|uniref:hypothetical protein n=1 Tax=Pseudoduganella sp. GCM10020061 TaxID=3317345 RepID=UPI003644E2B4